MIRAMGMASAKTPGGLLKWAERAVSHNPKKYVVKEPEKPCQ